MLLIIREGKSALQTINGVYVLTCMYTRAMCSLWEKLRLDLNPATSIFKKCSSRLFTNCQSKITSSSILLYYWKQRSKSHSYRTTKNQDSWLLIKNLIFILSFASPKNCFLENTTVLFIHPSPPFLYTHISINTILSQNTFLFVSSSSSYSVRSRTIFHSNFPTHRRTTWFNWYHHRTRPSPIHPQLDFHGPYKLTGERVDVPQRFYRRSTDLKRARSRRIAEKFRRIRSISFTRRFFGKQESRNITRFHSSSRYSAENIIDRPAFHPRGNFIDLVPCFSRHSGRR